MSKTIYLATLDSIDYTNFNEETEDWSGDTLTVETNEVVKAETLYGLFEKLANICNTTTSDIEENIDSPSLDTQTTFTQQEESQLVDYYLTIYKAEKIALDK